MARIENINDFMKETSLITSFSHAYLFNVNSLDSALFYVKEFAKLIIKDDLTTDSFEYQDISYKIDHDEFDDLYIVNPTSIGINTEEISKLLNYMQTKSIRDNGRRVYIIYGFERLTNEVSNKILKFLEEPNDNIYALLMTENFEKILPTIVSRCQVLSFFFPVDNSHDVDESLKEFISKVINDKTKTIAYEYKYFDKMLQDRKLFYDAFNEIEQMISHTLNKKYVSNYNEAYVIEELLEYPKDLIINVLNITNKLKCLIKSNINLNLLLDRYIIEITKELDLCKK